MEAIMPVHSFDEDMLTYPDFLEALVRVSQAYPFSDEQLAELNNPEAKFMYMIDVLDEKHSSLKTSFLKKLDDRTAQQEYDPRLVDNEPKRDSLME